MMSNLILYPHQQNALDACMDLNKVAFYHDMGLGKTFTGSEKLKQLNGKTNLVICQKSKIGDWIEHFKEYYDFEIFDLTKSQQFISFINNHELTAVGIINYDLVFRRKDLKSFHVDTLMLDESSLIQNENSKRAKFILKDLKFKNVILLSGTPTSGKYENLWSQLKLLGWKISKDLYWQHYIDFEWSDKTGFPMKVVRGYKNVDRLKSKLREFGAQFLKTEEVLSLPEQIEQTIQISTIPEYRKFAKDALVNIDDKMLIGDTILTKILYQRQLCGQYNSNKLNAFQDLLESTNDRLVVFYNYTAELVKLLKIVKDMKKPYSIVNGIDKNLDAYENCDNSVTFVQYQAGAMGLNLQKANKIIYFTLPFGKGSCGLWEQSKKRIHRIGQKKTCFYYYLLCKNSIEETNLKQLKLGKDLTDELFIEVMNGS